MQISEIGIGIGTWYTIFSNLPICVQQAHQTNEKMAILMITGL